MKKLISHNPNREIIIISAMTNNNVIGIGEKLPWDNLKDDMTFFKNETTGNICIMGFNTWDSFGRRPLPNRINIIITNRSDINHPAWKDDDSHIYNIGKEYDLTNTWFVNDIDEALDLCENMYKYVKHITKDELLEKRIFVIGGGSIYKQFLDLGIVNTMLLSSVNTTILENDYVVPLVYFPKFDESDFFERDLSTFKKDDRNEFEFTIKRYWKK